MKKKGRFLYPRIYSDRPGIKGQSWILFAVKVSEKRVKLDKREHINYKWLNYKEAYRKLSFNEKKRCLRLVNDRFNSQ